MLTVTGRYLLATATSEYLRTELPHTANMRAGHALGCSTKAL